MLLSEQFVPWLMRILKTTETKEIEAVRSYDVEIWNYLHSFLVKILILSDNRLTMQKRLLSINKMSTLKEATMHPQRHLKK